jgi:hypothetical protein
MSASQLWQEREGSEFSESAVRKHFARRLIARIAENPPELTSQTRSGLLTRRFSESNIQPI